jgi:hypothetical protein
VACGDVTSSSLVITNNSSAEQAFEFGQPAGSHLAICPAVGVLPPRCSTRVLLDFAPPPQLAREEPSSGMWGRVGTCG